MPDGIDVAIEYAKAQANKSPYYLLFSKESNNQGIYKRIHIDIRLPLGLNECSSNERLVQIENILEELANSYLDGKPTNYEKAVIETINAAQQVLGSLYCCREAGLIAGDKKSNSACTLLTLDQLAFSTYHNLSSTSQEYCKYSNDIQGLIDRYDQCVLEDWITYPQLFHVGASANSCVGGIDDGIIPICLVENLQIQNGVPDVEFGRFSAGVIDGAYTSISQIPEALAGIGNLIVAGVELQDAFTWAWVRCNPIFYGITYQECLEYEQKFDDLIKPENDPNGHLKNLFEEIKNGGPAYYEILAAYINDCDKKADLRNDVISFFTDFEQIKTVFESIKMSIGEFIDSFTPDTRSYCSGRLVGNIIVGILGDKGISKAATLIASFNKIQNALGPLMRLSGDQTELYKKYAAIVKKYPNEFKKIPQSVISKYIDDVATIEKLADDFRKNPDFARHLNGLSDPVPAVKAWKVMVDLPPSARSNADNLDNIIKYSDNFGKSFDDIGDEFANVPASQRLGWIDHLEFRTKSSGQVNKAGDRATDFNKFQNNSDVPQKYIDDKSRFNALSSDPDQGGAIKAGTRREATAGLELESQGIVNGITRGPKGIEFYDANRTPWDVKTPTGNFFKVTNTVETPAGSRGIGDAIFDELTKSKTIDGVTHPPGQFIDEITGVAKDKKVILDSSYIGQQQLDQLRSWLQNSSGLNSAQLSRIVEVNVVK